MITIPFIITICKRIVSAMELKFHKKFHPVAEVEFFFMIVSRSVIE